MDFFSILSLVIAFSGYTFKDLLEYGKNKNDNNLYLNIDQTIDLKKFQKLVISNLNQYFSRKISNLLGTLTIIEIYLFIKLKDIKLIRYFEGSGILTKGTIVFNRFNIKYYLQCLDKMEDEIINTLSKEEKKEILEKLLEFSLIKDETIDKESIRNGCILTEFGEKFYKTLVKEEL